MRSTSYCCESPSRGTQLLLHCTISACLRPTERKKERPPQVPERCPSTDGTCGSTTCLILASSVGPKPTVVQSVAPLGCPLALAGLLVKRDHELGWGCRLGWDEVDSNGFHPLVYRYGSWEHPRLVRGTRTYSGAQTCCDLSLVLLQWSP